MATYEIVDVVCIICKKSMKPSETDMPLFRVGYQVHNEEASLDCITTLAGQIDAAHRGMPMQK